MAAVDEGAVSPESRGKASDGTASHSDIDPATGLSKEVLGSQAQHGAMEEDVQALLSEMQGSFKTFSETVFAKIDTMSEKVKALERNVDMLASQVDEEDAHSPVENEAKPTDSVFGAGENAKYSGSNAANTVDSAAAASAVQIASEHGAPMDNNDLEQVDNCGQGAEEDGVAPATDINVNAKSIEGTVEGPRDDVPEQQALPGYDIEHSREDDLDKRDEKEPVKAFPEPAPIPNQEMGPTAMAAGNKLGSNSATGE